jgi:hypothetical protein
MLQYLRSVAGLTLKEVVHARMLLFTLAVVGACIAAGVFLGSLAVTEARETVAALTGALLRLAAVLLVAMLVIASVLRELNDRVLELLLALPRPRWAYALGKLAGFAAYALVLAGVAALALLPFTTPAAAAAWGFSLWWELLIVVCVSLFALFTFSQLPMALGIVLGFYALARSIGAIQLMARGPFADATDPLQRLAAGAVDGVAYLMPDLYRFTQSRWLVYADMTAAELAMVALQGAVYAALLWAAALFDLYRREL